MALAAVALSAACSEALETPRIVLTNGRILSQNRVPEAAEAIALGGGRVLALGSSTEIASLAGPGTRVVDLAGAFVSPAFVDHHVHLLNLGLSILNRSLDKPLFADLTDSGSLRGLLERLREQGASQPAGGWILGKGWSQAAWGDSGLPTHHVLSREFPDRPVFLSRVDGHAGWLNQEALRLAGITRDSPDPPGGRILRLPDGLPSGVLLEGANEAIVPLLPPLPDSLIGRAFRAAAEAMAQLGVTRVYDAGFLAPPGVVALNLDSAHMLELLLEEDRERPLPIDIHLMLAAPGELAERALAQTVDERRLSDRIVISHLKLFADGAMGSRGAALSHGFADDAENRGVPRMTRSEIRDWSLRALRAGLDVATHAIGDSAVRDTLDAYADVLKEQPGTPPGRLRIEHFSYAAAADIERAAEMGIVLSIQPNFIYPDASGQTMEDSRVGEESSSRVYAWGTLNRLQAKLAGGSDYFGMPGPALQTYYSALTRANPEGLPDGGWHSLEKLSPDSALDLMWRFHPPGAGSVAAGLSAGSGADLVILSHDPRILPGKEALQVRVLATMRRGEVVWGSLLRDDR